MLNNLGKADSHRLHRWLSAYSGGILKLYLILLCLLISLISAGCSQSFSLREEYGAEAYEIVDYQGTVVKLPHKPQRILTLSLGFDVMTLGVAEPKRLVAVNKAAADPGISYIVEETKQINPKLLAYAFETVVALKPDLIIASTWTNAEMIAGYRDIGIPVIVCKGPDTVEDVQDTVMLIARAVGEEEAGRNVVKTMEAELKVTAEVIARQGVKKRVGMLISQMTSYGGKGCMFDEMCTKAGVINGISAMGLSNGQPVTKEAIVACKPDFFMVSEPRRLTSAGSKAFLDSYVHDPALQSLSALKHITPIPDRHLYSATQNCVYAIRGIANAAYGDLFDLSQEKLIKGY